MWDSNVTSNDMRGNGHQSKSREYGGKAVGSVEEVTKKWCSHSATTSQNDADC